MNTRLISVYILYDVIVGKRSLSSCLSEQLEKISNPPDKGLTQEIVFGTLRNYPSLQLTLRQYLKKPISEKNKPLEILLCAGLYQLISIKLPEYAVINESVNATKDIDFEWATGFVNGVLRSAVRDEKLVLKRDKRYDHAPWLYDLIEHSYPYHAQQIFDNNHSPANVMLRIRPQFHSRDDYLEILHSQDIEAKAHADNKEAIVLTANTSISQLPHFDDGHITVQDANAQLAANLLGVKKGMKVLDACAAPGGKTAHIYDKAVGVSLTAVDNSASRVERLNNTLDRLGVSVNVVVGDVANPHEWHDDTVLFERILLDVPCSATGVIRKHPDILFHRTQRDIEKLITVQAELLDVCWQLLSSGGRLLYATCSILPQENTQQIDEFLSRTDNAVLSPIAHNRSVVNDASGMLQFLPDADGDGFFYALLSKVSG